MTCTYCQVSAETHTPLPLCNHHAIMWYGLLVEYGADRSRLEGDVSPYAEAHALGFPNMVDDEDADTQIACVA